MVIKNMRNKKGVSPVIATVLLIAIVVVIAFIVFAWIRGISEEAITKFDGTNVKLVCEDVIIDASYSGGYVYLSNTGNVPIYRLKAKIEGPGSHTTITFEDNWPETGLLQGATYSGSVSEDGERMILLPVLIGKTEDGAEKTYTCEERFGIEVSM